MSTVFFSYSSCSFRYFSKFSIRDEIHLRNTAISGQFLPAGRCTGTSAPALVPFMGPDGGAGMERKSCHLAYRNERLYTGGFLRILPLFFLVSYFSQR
ncbi:MAG: hypothetical protein ACE1Y4_11745 [Lysobacterales bacterium]